MEGLLTVSQNQGLIEELLEFLLEGVVTSFDHSWRT